MISELSVALHGQQKAQNYTDAKVAAFMHKEAGVTAIGQTGKHPCILCSLQLVLPALHVQLFTVLFLCTH